MDESGIPERAGACSMVRPRRPKAVWRTQPLLVTAILLSSIALFVAVLPAIYPRVAAEEALDSLEMPASVGPAASSSPVERDLLNAINARRAEAGLPPTANDDTLSELARSRSQDMVARNYFSHTTPDGSNVFGLLRAAGLASSPAGEILGRTNAPLDQSVPLVVSGFMNSPAHRDNIMNGRFVRAGAGAATSSSGMRYYTVIFLGE